MDNNDKSVDLLLHDEVPSPIDFRRMEDALSWTKEANIKRPFRYDFFNAIEAVIKTSMHTKSKSWNWVLVLDFWRSIFWAGYPI